MEVDLLAKVVSALGEVVSVDIEQLRETGDALHHADAHHCDWIGVAGGDGTVESVASSLVGTTFLWALFPRAHLTTLPEASTCPSTPSRPAT